jgi:two-component system, LytTR family, response regulator
MSFDAARAQEIAIRDAAHRAGDLRPAGPPYRARIAVRSQSRIVIVPVAEIVRLDAEDNYVRLWAARQFLVKSTLTALVASLDPLEFVRVHRSHAVRIAAIREITPYPHGEYRLVFGDGTAIASGRTYRDCVRRTFGLGERDD